MKENNKKKQAGKTPELKELNIMGSIYQTTYSKKYENRKRWSKPNIKEVVSFIPGTIREVLVKEGDIVVLDQKLLVLEAMKMMNTIYAPIAGKIKKLNIKTGDCLPKGTLMIEFE